MKIAGTGHRPKFCPCLYDEDHEWLLDLRGRTSSFLKEQSPEFVITGMAIGWDTWLAQEALKLDIPIKAYVPFRGQGNAWPPAAKKEYQRLLDLSLEVKYISENYHSGAFHQRDRAMVDDCDLVVALLNPKADKGGTYYTVQYAKGKEKEVINFWK